MHSINIVSVKLYNIFCHFSFFFIVFLLLLSVYLLFACPFSFVSIQFCPFSFFLTTCIGIFFSSDCNVLRRQFTRSHIHTGQHKKFDCMQKDEEKHPANQTPALANCKQFLFRENRGRENEDREISLSKP